MTGGMELGKEDCIGGTKAMEGGGMGSDMRERAGRRRRSVGLGGECCMNDGRISGFAA